MKTDENFRPKNFIIFLSDPGEALKHMVMLAGRS